MVSTTFLPFITRSNYIVIDPVFMRCKLFKRIMNIRYKNIGTQVVLDTRVNASFINIKLPDMPQFYVNNIRASETAHERIKGNAFVKWFT